MAKKVGRNDPCPCGSGKKYKRCCLRGDHSAKPNSARVDIPLSVLRNLYREADEVSSLIVKEQPSPPLCHQGCSMCCYQLFTVTPLEAFVCYEYHVRGLETEGRDAFVRKVAALSERVAALSPAATALLQKIETADGLQKMEEVQRPYAAAASEGRYVPCPFLNEATRECLVYEVRPLACRFQFSRMDKKYCDPATQTGVLAEAPGLISFHSLPPEGQRAFMFDLRNLHQVAGLRSGAQISLLAASAMLLNDRS